MEQQQHQDIGAQARTIVLDIDGHDHMVTYFEGSDAGEYLVHRMARTRINLWPRHHVTVVHIPTSSAAGTTDDDGYQLLTHCVTCQGGIMSTLVGERDCTGIQGFRAFLELREIDYVQFKQYETGLTLHEVYTDPTDLAHMTWAFSGSALLLDKR